MLSDVLTYENIASALSEFVKRCDIMPHGSNARHSRQNLIDIMMPASTCTASVGGYAASLQTTNHALPSGEWVRKTFARTRQEVVQQAIDDTISDQIAKLQKSGVLKKSIHVAIDKHLIPRYDKKPGPDLLRSKSKKGTWRFEGYITAQCVDAGRRLTLAAFPVGMGHSTADFVRKIIQTCDRYGIRVKCFFMDREFFSVSVLETMNSHGKSFVTPCRNTYNVVAALDEFDKKIRDGTSEVTLENQDSSVKYIMVVQKRTARKDKSPDAPAHERYIGFAANSNETYVAAYRKRWGIETAYRQIEGIRLKTRSTNPAARLFCFAASVVLFNQWVVINAGYGFGNDGKWQGITFTVLTFKTLMVSRWQIRPEPPPVTAP